MFVLNHDRSWGGVGSQTRENIPNATSSCLLIECSLFKQKLTMVFHQHAGSSDLKVVPALLVAELEQERVLWYPEVRSL